MFRTIEDFKKQWEGESKFTLAVFEALTDTSLSQAINDDHRTIGRMAWHITETLPEMMCQTGLSMSEIEKKVPATASEIAATYKAQADSLLKQVTENWQDADLLVEDDLYGEKWARGRTLAILINHEIHHRAQITVLMRQAGVVVPSLYGPAKEGWEAYGQKPPAI